MKAQPLNRFENYLLEQLNKASQKGYDFKLFSVEKLKEMYLLASLLYRDKKYQEAVPFFQALTVANPTERSYWKALGASWQMTKDYNKALQAYHTAQSLNSENPDVFLFVYTIDCYIALEETQKALNALETAKKIALKQHNSSVLNHLALMHQRWFSSREVK